MANIDILGLPVAVAVDGSEYFPLVQGDTTKRAATGLIMAGSASQSVQTANTVFAGPTTGAAATPTFRALVDQDMPVGTSGYALIGNGASTPTYQGFLQAGVGAVTRTWQAKGRDIVSVKDFGATLDGVTDDLAAIQAAIDGSANGTDIYIPAGTAALSGVIKLAGTSGTKVRMGLHGDGAGTRLVLNSGLTTNVVEITAGTGFTVRDITLVGTQGSVTPPYATDASYRYYNGIYVGGDPAGSVVSDVILENVRAEDCAYAGFCIGTGPLNAPDRGVGVRGVRVIGCRAYSNHLGLNGGEQINVEITGCEFIDNASTAIVNDDGSNVVSVTGCTIDGSTAGSFNSYGIQPFQATNLSYVGNTIKNTKAAIFLITCDNVVISGNGISGVAGNGITVYNTTQFSVASNAIQSSTNYGIRIYNNARRGSLIGNTVSSSTLDNIVVESSYIDVIGNIVFEGGGNGIFLNGASECTVALNICRDNGNAGVGYDGIKLTDASNNYLHDNRCNDAQGSPTQEYGIRSTGTSNTNTVWGNRLTGNATGTYSLVGSANLVGINGAALIDMETFTVQKTVDAATQIIAANASTGSSASARLIGANGTSEGGIIVRGVNHANAQRVLLYNNSTTEGMDVFLNGSARVRFPVTGGVVTALAALATNATTGFTYLPTCAGAPSGTPATQTGTAPVIFDSSNSNFSIYSGAWKTIYTAGGTDVPVTDGGTGASAFTAYAVICGGTTSTGSLQSVASVGTTGQLLTSNGPGALPTFQSAASAIGQAFTRIDDTNVTATLGGAPTTAVLSAMSLTLGWTGQLALTRGGTNATTARAACANLGTWYVVGASSVQTSHTGDTNETTLATITVPAGAMGANGFVRVFALYSFTNSVNAKTCRVRFNGIGGTVYASAGLTSVATWRAEASIGNRNSASSQVGGPNNTTNTFSSSTTAVSTSAVDTTSAVDIVLTGQLTNSGETIAIESYVVELYSVA